MPVTFKLPQPICGFAATSGEGGERVAVTVREIVSSFEGAVFTARMEALHSSIFGLIPSLPNPWSLDHLLVVIKPNLEATAYFNELTQIARAKVSRPVEKGAPLYEKDIQELVSLDLGVEIPPDCGFAFVRSFGWRRSLFYDFAPLILVRIPSGSRFYLRLYALAAPRSVCRQ